MIKNLLTLVLISISMFAKAQYAPGAGIEGSTAMHLDSSAFKAWATSCTVTRGPENISKTSSVMASSGNQDAGIGKAGASTVSLGDGGFAILTFASPIVNGKGNDFAVFENGFNISGTSDFLELAFVEVSSDGTNYFRFPAKSATPSTTQVGSFGGINATNIHNLAGKYLAGYGTPFDLEELKDIAGLNVNAITHVKIIDVIGTIKPQYATMDSDGNIVNDPWPTEFVSSGFDLDAVGVINSTLTSIASSELDKLLSIYPNPASTDDIIQLSVLGISSTDFQYSIYDYKGFLISTMGYEETGGIIPVKNLSTGLYIIKIGDGENQVCRKLIINN